MNGRICALKASSGHVSGIKLYISWKYHLINGVCQFELLVLSNIFTRFWHNLAYLRITSDPISFND